MTAPIIIGERCHYCSRFRSPSDILDWPGGAKICTTCHQRHLDALHSLSTGTPPKECSECGLSLAELTLRDAHSDTGLKMVCHFENGVYRFLCVQCDATYTPKRRDLYGQTEFGKALKL